MRSERLTNSNPNAELILCKLCPDGGHPLRDPSRTGFFRLEAHLRYIHGTNEQEYRREAHLPENSPLFTQHYSNSRRNFILEHPEHIERGKNILRVLASTRTKVLKTYQDELDLFTPHAIGKITGFSDDALTKAIKDKRLNARKLELGLGGPPIWLIRREDVIDYATHIRSSKLRTRVVECLLTLGHGKNS
jgi:hypothetical protein